MRILVIGGTAFTGPHVVRRLVREGHEVVLFYRGQTDAKLPKAVRRFIGDRRDWETHKEELRRFEPEVVLEDRSLPEAVSSIGSSTPRALSHSPLAMASTAASCVP